MIQIILMITAIVCIALGVLIFINNSHKSINLLATGINIGLSLGILSFLLFLNSSNSESALFYMKTGYAASLIVTAFMTIFVFVFPKGEHIPKLVSSVILLSCVVLISLLLLLPGFVIGSAVINSTGSFCSVVDSPSYIMYCLYLAFFFSFAIVALVRKIIVLDERYKMRLGVYLFGMLAVAIPSLVTNIVMPYFQDCQLLWVGPLMTSVFTILISYNIIRHGLFDIRWAAVRTLTYVLSLTVLAVVFFVLSAIISNLFFKDLFLVAQNPFSIGLLLILLLIFQPVKKFFDRFTNRIFYRNDYDRDEFFTRFNKLLTSTTYLRSLLEQVANEIASNFKSSQVFIYVYTRDGNHTSAGTEHYPRLLKSDIDYLQDISNKNTKVIVASLLNEEDPIKLFMIKHHLELIIPLIQADFVGYCFLGENQTSNYYSPRDINVLTVVADELVIAIQNRLSIQEVRDVNAASLQARVDIATKELRMSNESLRKMDEEKDEFVSVVSHELRTPLSVIRGYVDLLKRGRLGTLNKDQKKVLGKMDKSDKSLINLVNDMLDLSKLEANKLEVNLSNNSIDDLINNSLEQMQILYKSKNISLSYEGVRAQIKTNPEQFERIMYNLLSNSYKFTPNNGSVKVTAIINKNKHLATICIADTGIGISETDIAGIFRKFSQLNNYLQRQSSGTGLGLSISKGLVEKLGGTIWVESEVGVGSKFYFTIPLA